MAVLTSKLILLVRGMAVDKAESGIVNLWTDEEVIESINQAKHDLFGRRPDAFSTLVALTTEPADVETGESTLEIATWAEMPLCYLASSILMAQRSKDAYYRKASEQNLQKYLGGI